jgi:hypothetical protein
MPWFSASKKSPTFSFSLFIICFERPYHPALAVSQTLLLLLFLKDLNLVAQLDLSSSKYVLYIYAKRPLSLLPAHRQKRRFPEEVKLVGLSVSVCVWKA